MVAKYDKAVSGHPFRMPASVYNDTLRLIANNPGGALGRDGSGDSAKVRILIKNETGIDLSRYEIVTVGTTAIIDPSSNEEEFDTHIVLPGSRPVVGNPIAITRTAIPAGETGEAILFGSIQCSINVIAATDEFADVIAVTTTHLTSATSGPARIVWKESGTGVKRAIVNLGSGGSGGDSFGFVTATLDQDITEITEITAIDSAFPFAHGTAITGTIVDGYQGASEKPATGVRTGKIRLVNPSRFYGAQNTPFTAIDSGIPSGLITSSGVTENVNYFVIQSMACNELSEACSCGSGFTPV